MTQQSPSTSLDHDVHSQDVQGHDAQEHVAKARKQRIKALFLRYPNVDSAEREELVTYMKTGPLLEIGLLKGDETIRYRIAAFEEEQQKALKHSPIDIVVILVIFAIAVGLCSALWDIGT